MKLVMFSLMLVCVLSVTVFTQSLSVKVSYSRIEKSKDVREQLETFEISNFDAFYSVKYTGHVFPGEINSTTGCLFSENGIRKTRESIIENHIAQNVYRDEHYFEGDVHSQYITISIPLTMDGEDYVMAIEGDSSRIMDSKDYRNAIEFIKDLREIMKDC